MTGTRFFHMSLNVRGALKHWKPRDFRGVFSDNGRTLSVDEAKDRLLDELAKGHKLIPCCDDSACPEFDRTGGGCPGHDREPLRSPSECIDSCGSGEPCDPAACPLPAPTP